MTPTLFNARLTVEGVLHGHRKPSVYVYRLQTPISPIITPELKQEAKDKITEQFRKLDKAFITIYEIILVGEEIQEIKKAHAKLKFSL